MLANSEQLQLYLTEHDQGS